MNTTPSVTSSVAPRVAIGLDVSKDTRDVCLLLAGKRHEKQFTNDAAAHRQPLRWARALAKGQTCHFCLEATGPYSQNVALFLVEKEQKASVINPARIKYFGLVQNQGNKTDKARCSLSGLVSSHNTARCRVRRPGALTHPKCACCRSAGDGAASARLK